MAMTIGDGSLSSFSQQGTIDWVQLANTGVTATVAILSRISAANVDPFTLTVAQALASQYKLSALGKTRMNESLQSLRCFASLRNVLWFGFGINHVVRILSLTNQGMSTIALCGSLSEVMSTEMVASILDELPDIYGAPQELRPSLSQWEALVTSCDKVISSTNFGLVAEHFMNLSGDNPVTPASILLKDAPGATKFRTCGKPRDVAAALHTLGKVSSRSLIAAELRGGAVCGLLAALGYWFLGLEVEIRKGEAVVYRSVFPEQPVQFVVRYPHGSANEQGSRSSLEVHVASTSYHICNISSILTDRAANFDSDNHIISGRVSWDQAIHNTFGTTGKELLEAHYHLGQVFGTAARMFVAISISEPNELNIKKPFRSTPMFKSVIVHNENSFGTGFLHFAINRLPELSVLDIDKMQECLEYPLAKAHEHFEAAMKRLAMLCNCVMCNEPDDPTDFSRYKTFCIPVVAEVLVVALESLAIIHADTDLNPYRAGLEGLYRRYEHRLMDSRLRINRVISSISMMTVYETAELLYTGRQPKAVSLMERGLPPAFSANGMTFYLDILRELSDDPGSASRLHVVPGNMTLDSNRVYTTARDSEPSGIVDYQATDYQPLSSLPTGLTDTSNTDLGAKLVVTAGTRELSVEFSFTRADRPLFSIGPTDLVDRIAQASFSVHCLRRQCSEIKPPLSSVFTVDGEGRVDIKSDLEEGRLIVIRRLQGNPIARCIALGQNAKFDVPRKDLMLHDPSLTIASQDEDNKLYHENVILKADECWSCCIKAASKAMSRNDKLIPVIYIL